MAALVPVSPGPLANWQQLTETVRTGRPADPIDDDPAAFYVPLVEGTFTTISRMATRADGFLRYSALDAPHVSRPRRRRCAMDRRDADCQSERNGRRQRPARRDRRRRTQTGRAGPRAHRVEFRPGDFHEVELETDHYDIVVLGHICRTEGAERDGLLIDRAFAALRPGGRIVLSDYFADRQRTLAGHALMMGVTMMASTVHGQALSYGDVADRLRCAGFEAVRLIEPIGFQEAFVASRPPSAGPATRTPFNDKEQPQ